MSSDKGSAGKGMPEKLDMIVVGGGPAGAACAITAKKAGLEVGLLERSSFPRHKVCGDCLNPAVWPLLDELGVAAAVLQAEHVRLEAVAFATPGRDPLTVPIPPAVREIVVARALFDAILMDRVIALGVPVLFGCPVTGLAPAESGRWRVRLADGTSVRAKVVVGADGRNSIIARCLGVSTKPSADRVALQTHLPRLAAVSPVVEMRILPDGYAGLAPVSACSSNLCLVGLPGRLPALEQWATHHFELGEAPDWRSLTPMRRRDHLLLPKPGVLLAGDAARVVEPFTGEGIYYALASGMDAARCVAESGGDFRQVARRYAAAHASLYAGRLWVNRLARLAATQPWLGKGFIDWSRRFPSSLRLLTGKVIR